MKLGYQQIKLCLSADFIKTFPAGDGTKVVTSLQYCVCGSELKASLVSLLFSDNVKSPISARVLRPH
jgi:hypothetical protein